MIRNLTTGKPSKVLFFFALPMLLGNIFQQVYNIADSVIVGNFVGSDALAAVGGTFSIVYLAIGIATGASTGCSIIISQAFGAGNMRKVKSSITTALISVTCLGALMTILFFFFLKPLLTLLGTPDKIFNASYNFISIVFFGCIFVFVYNCLAAIFNALGDSKIPLIFLIFSTVLNVILDILFVVKMNIGTNGAGYATLISQVLAAISLFIYFLFRFKKIKCEGEVKLFDIKIAREMFGIALPSIIQQTMVSIGMMAVQGLVNSHGTNMVAGYTAATKIDSIAIMPMLNISIALSTYTAQNIGARNIKRVEQGFRASIMLVAVFSIIISILLVVCGDVFVKLFISTNTNQEVIRFGSEYFKIVSVFYILMGVMFCSNGVLRGLGFMKIFMTCTIFNLASRIIFAYALTPFLGYKAIYWALPIGWLIGGMISFVFVVRGKWKAKYIT